jgi:hypothetical protein
MIRNESLLLTGIRLTSVYASVRYVSAALLAGTTPNALIPSPNAGRSQ